MQTSVQLLLVSLFVYSERDAFCHARIFCILWHSVWAKLRDAERERECVCMWARQGKLSFSSSYVQNYLFRLLAESLSPSSHTSSSCKLTRTIKSLYKIKIDLYFVVIIINVSSSKSAFFSIQYLTRFFNSFFPCHNTNQQQRILCTHTNAHTVMQTN